MHPTILGRSQSLTNEALDALLDDEDSEFRVVRELQLENNSVGPEWNTQHVCIMALQNCYFDLNRFEVFPMALIMCTQLVNLSLQSNRLEELPEEICQLVSLRSLNLSYNRLLNVYPLSPLLELESLDLSSNPKLPDSMARRGVSTDFVRGIAQEYKDRRNRCHRAVVQTALLFRRNECLVSWLPPDLRRLMLRLLWVSHHDNVWSVSIRRTTSVVVWN